MHTNAHMTTAAFHASRGSGPRGHAGLGARGPPGMSTASWEVTGVLYRGGVIKLPRARSARVFCPPQARKFWRC